MNNIFIEIFALIISIILQYKVTYMACKDFLNDTIEVLIKNDKGE